MEVGEKFCVICFDTITTSSKSGRSRKCSYSKIGCDSITFNKFLRELESQTAAQIKGGKWIDLKEASVCNCCFATIKECVDSRERAKEQEEAVLQLQTRILRELKVLGELMEEFCGNFRELEDTVKCSTGKFLEHDNGLKSDLGWVRDAILNAGRRFQLSETTTHVGVGETERVDKKVLMTPEETVVDRDDGGRDKRKRSDSESLSALVKPQVFSKDEFDPDDNNDPDFFDDDFSAGARDEDENESSGNCVDDSINPEQKEKVVELSKSGTASKKKRNDSGAKKPVKKKACAKRPADPDWTGKVKRKYKRKDRPAFVPKQNCEICGAPVPLEQMPEHMASHVGVYAFKCPNPRCSYTFASKWSRGYRKHIHAPSGDRNRKDCRSTAIDLSISTGEELKISCESCGKEFKETIKLGYHLKEHETFEKNLVCPLFGCGMEFTTKQSLEYHLRVHTNYLIKRVEHLSREKCGMCGKRMNTDEFAQHLQVEHELEEDKLVRCKLCSFAGNNQEAVVNHMGQHLREEGASVLCDLCLEEGAEDSKIPYFSLRKLRQHYFEKHGVGKILVCEREGCEFSCHAQNIMNRHVRVVHEGVDPKRFKCGECEAHEGFRTEGELITHRVSVHGEEPIKCRFCEETFTSVERKKKHERFVHEGKERKVFVCDLCGASLSSGKSYTTHLESVHAERRERKWSCDQCGKAYTREDTLRVHLRNAHGDSKCVCEVCGRELKTAKLLQQHMRIHTGERPFQCEICFLRFRQKCTYDTHMKSHRLKGDRFKSTGTFERGCRGKKETN